MEIIGSQNVSQVEADNKQASMEERSKSTDPLTLDRNQASSEAQPNRSERSKQGKHSRRASDYSANPEKAADEPDLKKQRSFSQTHDGVFANLSAKPEIMVLPKDQPYNNDPPPAYTDTRPQGQVRFMTIDERVLADDVDSVTLDEYEVGTVFAYVIMVVIVLLFQVWGFIFSFIFAQTHATRLGSIGGLGLLIAFSSLSLEQDLERALDPTLQGWAPFISLFVGIAGYLMFIYSLTAYQKIRRLAENMVNLPGSTAPGVITII